MSNDNERHRRTQNRPKRNKKSTKKSQLEQFLHEVHPDHTPAPQPQPEPTPEPEPQPEPEENSIVSSCVSNEQGGLPNINWLKETYKTKSAAIRFLYSQGYTVLQISKHLRIKYQHARNVALTPLKRGPNEPWDPKLIRAQREAEARRKAEEEEEDNNE